MGKRVRISNDSLNSYGTRVLTAGMDVQQYERNPVLLYMHERGNVIGYVKDLKVENNEVSGELVFDEASELSKRCKKQYEFGSLRMVSVGIDIVEMSEDPQYITAGQASPTITKSKLYEVSLVDVGANDDALVMRKDGEKITLGKDGCSSLPQLNKPQTQTTKQMDQKVLALQLGLPEGADDAAISAAIGQLKAAKAENEGLKKDKAQLELANITAVVDGAISEKRITEEMKTQYVELGKKAGVESLKSVFATMQPRLKLSAVLGHHGGAPTGNQQFSKLGEVPADQIAQLKAENPNEYKRLYKAEYGMECEI